MAVGPLQVEFAAIHLPFDAQPVGQRRVFVLGQPGAFSGRSKHRGVIELAIKLAQVVEGNARRRQAGQLFSHALTCQIAQQAIAHAFVRHAAQLLLDRLDRVTQISTRGQLHREQAGKPAHSA